MSSHAIFSIQSHFLLNLNHLFRVDIPHCQLSPLIRQKRQTLKHLLFLFQDHIKEVLGKWESIDDEIWAKVIVLERNRRVAKAYARAPVLTVNGSDEGFDGFR